MPVEATEVALAALKPVFSMTFLQGSMLNLGVFSISVCVMWGRAVLHGDVVFEGVHNAWTRMVSRGENSRIAGREVTTQLYN